VTGVQTCALPILMKHTVIAYYEDTDEVVLARVEGRSVRQALERFFSDEDAGKTRRESCRVVAIIKGHAEDLLPTGFGDGAVSYEQIQEAWAQQKAERERKRGLRRNQPGGVYHSREDGA